MSGAAARGGIRSALAETARASRSSPALRRKFFRAWTCQRCEAKLVCFCAPKACHADLLLEKANH